MIDKIKQDAKARMEKSTQALKSELSKLRTGRAHPALIEHVKVSYYGNDTPLNQVASVAIEDARTLTVTPWEKPLVPQIEKAILSAGLGLNPVTAGQVIRVPMPALTEERRKDLIRVVRDEAEKARVSVRNVRRDANSDCKNLLKDKAISEDEERRAETDIQKITDGFVKQIDLLSQEKETDLMNV
ncbi:MAG: ribosome recycling factor [Gammaproteobacteria bacterium]|nr:ribosome recycling factor [Gammaproteobacteria bacterium]